MADQSNHMQKRLNELRQFIESHDDLQALLRQSASWADTHAESQEKSRATAWRVAIGVGIVAILAMAVAIAAVATAYQPPPQPEILLVDRITGVTERLSTLKEFQQSPEDATIRRNVATFLRARENYTFDNAEDYYFDAAAFMSPPMQQQWVQLWNTANPESPLNKYKKDIKIRIELGAITINRNVKGYPISVRASFTKTVKRGEMPIEPESAWIATIPFKWVNAPANERARRVNDLGFQITDYQVDADVGGRPKAGQAAAAQAQARQDLTQQQALVAPLIVDPAAAQRSMP